MAGAYQGGQELIGIGCLLMLRLSRLTSCCLMVIVCWLLVSGRFSANGFPRIVFREEECLAVVIVGVCDRRLLSLVITWS